MITKSWSDNPLLLELTCIMIIIVELSACAKAAPDDLTGERKK